MYNTYIHSNYFLKNYMCRKDCKNNEEVLVSSDSSLKTLPLKEVAIPTGITENASPSKSPMILHQAPDLNKKIDNINLQSSEKVPVNYLELWQCVNDADRILRRKKREKEIDVDGKSQFSFKKTKKCVTLNEIA